MTSRTRFFGLFSVIFGLLRFCARALGRGVRAVGRGLYEFVLISGSYPSLTRDPGLAAYRLLEGHPRRSRCFRQPSGAAVTAVTTVTGEPRLQFSAFL